MKIPVTYEEVDTLAEQLPTQEQLKLVAKISDRLSKQPAIQPQTAEENQHHDYGARVEAFLKMIDENAAECSGEVDSAADIRQIREERYRGCE